VKDEPGSERPCTSKKDENVTKLKAFVRSNQRFRFRMISSELNLNQQTVHDILTEELGMRKAGSKKSHQRTKGKRKEFVPGHS